MHLFLYKVCFSHLVIYISIRLRNISRFVTNAIHSSTHQTHIRLTIYNKKCLRIHILILRDYSSPTSLLQILQIFPGNRQSSLRGPAPLCRLKSDVLHNKKREVIFDLPRPPPPGTRPLQTIPHPRARRARLVPEIARGGMVTGKIEPCITATLFWDEQLLVQSFSCFSAIFVFVENDFYARMDSPKIRTNSVACI